MEKWNSFSRIEAVFDRKIPDRVPKYEGTIEIPDLNPVFNGQETGQGVLFFSSQQLELFHKIPAFLTIFKKALRHPSFLLPFARFAPKSISRLQRQFNYDLFSYIPGVPMIFKDKIFRDFYTKEKGRVVYGPNKRLVWKTSPGGAHTRHGALQSPEDWDKYIEFDADHPGNYFLVKETVKACKKLDIVPIFTVFGCGFFEELSGMFGFEALFKLLIKNKEFIKKTVKEMSDYSIAVAEQVIQNGGTYIYMTDDLGYKGRSIISPRMFKEYFKPGIKKFCYRAHQFGGKIMMHSCGHVNDLLPDIVETGVDALHPIEKEAGNDIVEIKKKYGKSLILVGNVGIPLLTHGTPKETYEYVKYLLKNVSKDGGHIISSSHSVTKWCKLKNFLAYYKAVEDFGKYPINIK